MLTNWKTISNSIKRYKSLSEELKKENKGFTKKEILKMGTERDKLDRSLGGIADMRKVPNMIFIIDTNIESLAVKEAMKLKIPIVAIIDTNSDPTGINYPIPGNDDARRAINLYCELVKQTVLDAQKNITIKEKDDEIDLKNKIHKKIEPNIQVKTEKIETKNKKETKEKKKTSIFSKIRNLASKKEK